MKRVLFWIWLLLSLVQSASAFRILAHVADWDTSACQPDSVFVFWEDSQGNVGWSYGRLEGPDGSYLYSFIWCDEVSGSQYIPLYSLVSQLCVRLSTGVEQYLPIFLAHTSCDPEPFPLLLPFGTFDGCNPMGNSTAVVEADLPQAFELKQNYPNPFNPSTTISFYLPFTGQVQVVVCNLLGQQVAELVNDQLKAGDHELQLDASNLSSGTYFCVLTSGQHSAVMKMLLIK